jgi:hypothetical protein
MGTRCPEAVSCSTLHLHRRQFAVSFVASGGTSATASLRSEDDERKARSRVDAMWLTVLRKALRAAVKRAANAVVTQHV